MKLLSRQPGTSRGEWAARLAAWMVNMELGRQAFDDAGRPAAGTPWPVLTLPPVTAAGLPVTAHWQPVSGIIFYTLDAEDSLGAFKDRLTAALAPYGYAHLAETPRAVAASLWMVEVQWGRVHPGTRCLVQEHPAVKRERTEGRGQAGSKYAARCLISYRDHSKGHVTHTSMEAAFTWHLLPAAQYEEYVLKTGGHTDWSLNAALASIYADGLGAVHALPDGAELTDGFRRLLASGDHRLPLQGPLLNRAREWCQLVNRSALALTLRRGHTAVFARAAWPFRGGTSANVEAAAPDAPLPATSLQDVKLRGAGVWCCNACDAPLTNQWPAAAVYNGPVAHLRCLPCWLSVDRDKYPRAYRITPPYPQDVIQEATEVWLAAQDATPSDDEASEAGRSAAQVLMRATCLGPLQGATGVYKMRLDAEDAAAIGFGELLLVDRERGANVHLTDPVIAGEQLPVYTGLNLQYVHDL